MDQTYSFGYWVKRQRKALDITQRALAACVGCAVVTVKKIEADERRPSALIARRLADCLAIAPHERARFLAMALGERPADALPLASQPRSKPADAIPQPVTPFLGRATECATLLAMIAQPEIRLISVIGPGGIGKTRLVLAVASLLRQQSPRPFPDGIIFTDLATVATADDLLPALVQAVHCALDNKRQETRSHSEQLLAHLAGKSALLILDNFEHLLPAAPWLETVLAHAPGVKLLVTARERLGIYSEHVYLLHPLHYPPTGTPLTAVGDYDAVKLFLAAARRLQPTFALTAENSTAVITICRLVAGIPLALELAAGWVDTLSVPAIANELQAGLSILESEQQYLAVRHRSMRTILMASWQRLPERVQRVFAHLCLFPGGFTRAAAATVAEATLSDLAVLISKAMLTADLPQERYQIHELLRQFGQAQLAASGESRLAHDRLLAWAIALAAEAEMGLTGAEQARWVQQLQADCDNLRAALQWAADSQQAEAGLQLATSLFRFWFIRGLLREGRAWLETFLQADLNNVPEALQAQALYCSGRIAIRQWDIPSARERGVASLEKFRLLGDRAGLVRALTLMALVAQEEQDVLAAITRYQEALALVQQLADPYMHAVVLHNLGLLYHEQGEYRQAVTYYQQAITLGREHHLPSLGTQGNLAELYAFQGLYEAARELAQANLAGAAQLQDVYIMGQEHLTLGLIARCLGETETAVAHYTTAARLHNELGTTMNAALAGVGLADVAWDQGDLETAQAHYQAAQQAFQAGAVVRGLAAVWLGLGRIHAANANWQAARAALQMAHQFAQQSGFVPVAVTAVLELAGVLAACGEREEAVRLWQAAQAQQQAHGLVTPPVERPRLAQLEAQLAL